MSLLIVTQLPHVFNKGNYYAYGPYTKEINIWTGFFQKVYILAPLIKDGEINEIDIPYTADTIEFIPVPTFNFLNLSNAVKALGIIPMIFFKLILAMNKADHIHLRCPGNMGLLGAVAQIFFPEKKKTAKYAGNWDWSIKQPKSYRFQQIVLRSTLLSKNMKVLVYGEWSDKTENILPFFTASYKNTDILPHSPRMLDGSQTPLQLLFVGTLSKNKNPDLCLEVAEILERSKVKFQFHFFGDGPLREELENAVKRSAISSSIHIHGNKSADFVKEYYKQSHFLVFISDSEGWPKVVAEAMFWGCIPITTKVSCVPQMLDFGSRGALVSKNPEEIANQIMLLVKQPEHYHAMSKRAHEWSTSYTLERFESEIGKLVQPEI